jgi:hypothetical protein
MIKSCLKTYQIRLLIFKVFNQGIFINKKSSCIKPLIKRKTDRRNLFRNIFNMRIVYFCAEQKFLEFQCLNL